jgi:tRNA(fMet)-specific endonuclease VapC
MPEYSLDSNIFRLFVEGNVSVRRRILSTPLENLWISSVVYHEALGGRLARLNLALKDKSSKSSAQIEQAHSYLVQTIEILSPFQILLYTAEDEQTFRALAPQVKRVGSQDCRIAAQALRRGMIVVTRNLLDFEAANVPCEDWSADSP